MQHFTGRHHLADAQDLTDVAADAATWEKVVRKLRAGVMPPLGRPRPDEATYDHFVAWLEDQLDSVAAAHPDPGRTETFHRLNRVEYRNAIRDLLAIDVNVEDLLPADDSSYGFDNIAGVLRMSPSLMERYLSAAKTISRLAVGTPVKSAGAETVVLPPDLTQEYHFDGLPFGTRAGASAFVRPDLVGDDGQVDALPLRRWRQPEVVHRQALGRAPVDAEGAADTGPLVDQHRRRLRAHLGAGHLG